MKKCLDSRDILCKKAMKTLLFQEFEIYTVNEPQVIKQKTPMQTG